MFALAVALPTDDGEGGRGPRLIFARVGFAHALKKPAFRRVFIVPCRDGIRGGTAISVLKFAGTD